MKRTDVLSSGETEYYIIQATYEKPGRADRCLFNKLLTVDGTYVYKGYKTEGTRVSFIFAKYAN